MYASKNYVKRDLYTYNTGIIIRTHRYVTALVLHASSFEWTLVRVGC